MARTATPIQNGKVIDFTSANGNAAGDVVSFTNFVGISVAGVASGGTGAAEIEGVFEFPIATAGSVALGSRVYWDASGTVMTTTSTAMVAAGFNVKAKATGDATIVVKLHPGG